MGNVSMKNKQTKMVDLPVEMLAEIAKYLSPKENVALGLTNKNLLNKYRSEYCMFKKIAFEVSNQQDFDNFASCKLNYNTLIVHNMEDKNKTLKCREKLRHVRNLQIIYNGCNALELMSLLERCRNLKVLHINIDRIMYDKHNFSILKVFTNFLKLTELHISYTCFMRLEHLISLIEDNKTITSLSFYGSAGELSHVLSIATKLKALRLITFNFRHYLTENETVHLKREINIINPSIKLIFPSLISRNFLK